MSDFQIGARVVATFGHAGNDPITWHTGTVTEQRPDGKWRIEWDCGMSDWAYVTEKHRLFVKVLSHPYSKINCHRLEHSRRTSDAG